MKLGINHESRVDSRNMRNIDYTRTTWGHNMSLTQREDGLLRGHIWHSSGATVGDRLTWKAAHGTSTGEIIECQWMRDPGDMYRVIVKVVARHSPEGVALG